MSRLADHFDALSALSEVERERALEALAATEPELAASLRALFLAEQAEIAEPPSTTTLLQWLPQHQDFDGFRLIRPLGAGGMGEVWLAERVESGVTQRAAVKMLRADRRGPDTGRRFLDEQRIVAGLSHPNIVRLIGMGLLVDGTPWLAMDLVEGMPLLEYCDRHRLGLRQRVQLLIEVLGAVQHAHQHLVVHRDLKSDHILVDADGEPRLLDFGIARRLDAAELQTAPGGGFFSPCNVSPEQLTGAPISVATDVYQLGLLLYRLLTGREAQDREHASVAALQQIVLEQSPVPPSERVNPEVAGLRSVSADALVRALRGDLDRIVLHALRAAPEERYPTATAFREDLEAWLASRPVRAVGQGRAYRLRKFVQRHRAAVVISSLAVLLLVIAGTVLLRQELALAQLTREAVSARDAATLNAVRAGQVRDLLLELFRESDPALDGISGAAARIDDAVVQLQRREAVLTEAPELALALAEAALGLGQHESARELLRALEVRAGRLSLAHERQRLLLQSRLAVATRDTAGLRLQLAAVAPLMAGADAGEQQQYLRLLAGVLLGEDPERVLRLTDLDPVPVSLVRIRARALLQIGRNDDAVRLLQQTLAQADVGRLKRLGLQQALVSALVEQGQVDPAQEVSEQMIDAARPLLGADSRAMVGYWNTRAIALAAAGQPERAVAILDDLLARQELADGVRLSLTLNRVLFGSAQPDPDAVTRRLLETYWPLRDRYTGMVQRFLLLARVRLLAHAGDLREARQVLRDTTASVEGADVESRLLRAWSEALDSARTGPTVPEGLARMDPHLARIAGGSARP